MRSPADAEFTVDVVAEVVVRPDGGTLPFALDPFRKYCLLEGVDGVQLGMSMLEGIEAYEANISRERPWEQHIDWDSAKDEP